jgi:hypothetical protein
MNPEQHESGSDPSPTSSIHRSLLTWDDVSHAINELIDRTQRTLDVFDHSLALQDWGSRARCEALQRAALVHHVNVRLLVVDAHFVSTQVPRLLTLLKSIGHRVTIMESDARELPGSSFAVADRQHFLFRPDSVQSKGALNFSNPAKSMGYADSFQVLWEQGGQRIFPEQLGL